jgi:hypothetical protein
VHTYGELLAGQQELKAGPGILSKTSPSAFHIKNYQESIQYDSISKG